MVGFLQNYIVSCMFATLSQIEVIKAHHFSLKQINIKLEMFYYIVVCVSVVQ